MMGFNYRICKVKTKKWYMRWRGGICSDIIASYIFRMFVRYYQIQKYPNMIYLQRIFFYVKIIYNCIESTSLQIFCLLGHKVQCPHRCCICPNCESFTQYQRIKIWDLLSALILRSLLTNIVWHMLLFVLLLHKNLGGWFFS